MCRKLICKHCKKEIPEDSFFCGYCGLSFDNSTLAESTDKIETETPKKPFNSECDGAQDIIKTDDPLNNQIKTKEPDFKEEEPDFSSYNASLNENQGNTAGSSSTSKEIERNTVNNIGKPPKTPVNASFAAEDKIDYVTPVRFMNYSNEIAKEFSGKHKPISTAGFFFTQLLLLIPLLNILLLFVWAFRKRTNANRQAFARSILIWMLLFLIIAAVGLLIMVSFGLTFEDIMIPLKQ
jgi:hypothetical protein